MKKIMIIGFSMTIAFCAMNGKLFGGEAPKLPGVPGEKTEDIVGSFATPEVVNSATYGAQSFSFGEIVLVAFEFESDHGQVEDILDYGDDGQPIYFITRHVYGRIVRGGPTFYMINIGTEEPKEFVVDDIGKIPQ